MTKIKEIIQSLEEMAPPAYAESYDNVGLIVGNSEISVSAILVSLDCTEDVVREAIDTGCNLIVSHHPILFKGIKRLTGSGYVERTVELAIKNDIALYAIHTNLDSVEHGVNAEIAKRIGLTNLQILQPTEGSLFKISFFVPSAQAHDVKTAMYLAGAGGIGKYSNCSFEIDGTGTFKPLPGANPYSGEVGSEAREAETRVEMMMPAHLANAVVNAMKLAHPYEEVAYYLQKLENRNQTVGSGMVGELAAETSLLEFLNHLKQCMDLKLIKYTVPTKTHRVRRVALCGGSGSFLLKRAIQSGADVFVSGDFKYHEYFDAENRIAIADIGHYESERFTIDLIAGFIRKKFSTFAVRLTTVNTNPIHYF